MEEKDFEIYALEYLRGQLSEDENRQFEFFLKENPERQSYLNELKVLEIETSKWSSEEPPFAIKESFYQALNEELKDQKASRLDQVDSFLGKLSDLVYLKRVAFFVLTLAIGVFLGNQRLLISNPSGVDDLTAQLKEVQENLAKIQLKSTSPYDRIQGVNYVSNSDLLSTELLDGLLFNLTQDESVNIRIATAQALIKFQGMPVVSKALESAMRTEEDGLAKMNLIRLVQSFNPELAEQEITKLLNDVQLQPQMRQVLSQLKRS